MIFDYFFSLQAPDVYKNAWDLLKVILDLFFFALFFIIIFLIGLLRLYSMQGSDGVLVPGGFGDRGVQGKILAAKYARENKVPFLGICLGMQIAVIEFARSALGLHDANSTEFDPETSHPCVIFMPEVCSTATVLTVPVELCQLLFRMLKLFAITLFYLTGFKNSHGGNYAFGVKEDLFQSSELQICKVVRFLTISHSCTSISLHDLI